MEKRTITAELLPEDEGYSVYCPELDIWTQGDDVKDALNNLREAAELFIETVGPEKAFSRRREILRQELELVVNG
ncbi:MAG: type II toxin-antitoxin system HicB family antitoxin [Nitrospirae bacterium]|nr:type II toxin-antitoxin system HicB family antitoxin [Nitrospirota bacterium]MBI5694358.1 type II toxin-antitoxin system HicB family antitoxin [Nitrospirota bacterium]